MGQFFTDIAKSNRVGLILEVPGTEAFQKLLQSQAGADVMKFDGVRPGAIVIFEKGPATCEGMGHGPAETLAHAVALARVLARRSEAHYAPGTPGMPNRHASAPG